MKKLGALFLGDIKNIRRDPMLLLALCAPILLAAACKWGIPVLTEILWRELSFDLAPHYEFIMSFIMLLPPFMLGIMAGLIILDDRDDNLLVYFAVTPLSTSGYLIYRLLLPFLLGGVLACFVIWLPDLIPFHPSKHIPIALLAALEAPIMALFMGAFSTNKVEGLALTKGAGFTLFLPILPYVFAGKWWVAMTLCAPTVWVSRALLASFQDSGDYWLSLVGGAALHILFIIVLLKLFQRRMAL